MHQKYDYIIVGQGIVGTILTFKLIQLGKKVLVIDDNHKYASSNVAAGIINPITGRNYVKSWKIEELIPEFESTYTSISDLLGYKYLINRNVVRVLHSAKEENAWMQRTGDISYVPFMSGSITDIAPNRHLQSDGKYGLILNGYQLKIAKLITDFRIYLEEQGMLKNEKFDFEFLTPSAIIDYKGIIADHIIFCEGYQVIHNPLFNYLPFAPVKGEVLIIKAIDLKLEDNYRDQIFVTPLGEDLYWIGAGYDKGFKDVEPTEGEKTRLLDVLSNIIICPFEVVDHMAGIRPAFKTRKPIIGAHPQWHNVYVCNGMGAKGSSLGPYFAQQLIDSIEKGGAVDVEVDINRFNN